MNIKFLFFVSLVAVARAEVISMTVKNDTQQEIWANVTVSKPGHPCALNVKRGINGKVLGAYIKPQNYFTFQVSHLCCGSPGTLDIKTGWTMEDKFFLPSDPKESESYSIGNMQCKTKTFTISTGSDGKLMMTQS